MDEAGTTIRNKKRISDCLGDSDGADEVDAAAASPPSPGTPRLRIPMFTCARFRFVRLGRKGSGGGRKDVVAAEKSEAASMDSSGWKAASSASTEAGMGLSLLFLLAKTCVELNKMAEVRAQMEALLEEMRDQLVRTKSTDHAAVPTTSSPDRPSTPPPCRASGTEDTNGRAASSSAMETASSESETPSEDKGSGSSMDVAGAGQFQLNWNTQQETSESSSDGEFIELEGGFGGAGNNLRRDSDDGDDEEHGDGVSAVELQRRLHELMHQRSRERIEELESSLRRAERKLMEKEMEARLWKDTAKLALQPPPPQQDGRGSDFLAVTKTDRTPSCQC